MNVFTLLALSTFYLAVHKLRSRFVSTRIATSGAGLRTVINQKFAASESNMRFSGRQEPKGQRRLSTREKAQFVILALAMIAVLLIAMAIGARMAH